MAIRFHFAGTIGVLVTLLLWPKRRDWKSESHFRACVFLVILFGLLFFLHAWASLGLNPQSHDAMGKNYCVFCFPLYLGFFSFVGLILVAASASFLAAPNARVVTTTGNRFDSDYFNWHRFCSLR